MARLRRKTVDRVIRECFWDGFQKGLCDGFCGGLEYASTSGLYGYNGVRRTAERAGYETAQELIEAALERRQARARGEREKFGPGFTYRIPGEVVAACYAEARIADKWCAP
jgi:hypothetical protein